MDQERFVNPKIKPPLFLSIPHSGEKVPPEAYWLRELSEITLFRDVDRFVDWLYEPVIKKLELPVIATPWHRYVVDPNRGKDEIDERTVIGTGPGSHVRGLHWSRTTLGEPLIREPLSQELHRQLVRDYYQPFHGAIREMGQKLKAKGRVFHLDLHSMPSVGTDLHPDPGQKRAEVVVSDFHGQSAVFGFKEIVVKAYFQAGFQVAYNKPYVGGGITRTYGSPSTGHNTLQVELNRALYMDEETKKIIPHKARSLKLKLEKAIVTVYNSLEYIQA